MTDKIKMSPMALASLCLAFTAELSDRDAEIDRHHQQIDELKENESSLVKRVAEADYTNGVLNGQITDLTDRLQRAEDSNKDAFNVLQQMKTDTTAVMQQESELSFELENLKEGKPVQLA